MILEERVVGSSLAVLEFIVKNGPSSPKDMKDKVGVSERTITYAIKDLYNKKVLKRIPNLSDMRIPLYSIDERKCRDYLRNYPHLISQFNPHFRSFSQ